MLRRSNVNRALLGSARASAFAGMSLLWTAVAAAQVSATSRVSGIRVTAFNGNGPALVTYDQTVFENGLLVSGELSHNLTSGFNDPYWGESRSDILTTQDIRFLVNGTIGLGVVGDILPNTATSTPIRSSDLGAAPISQSTTDSWFQFTVTVTEPTTWLITVNATKNPVADFAASLWRVDGGGYLYLCPLATPVLDSGAGTLAPGVYRFAARAQTRAFASGEGPVTDSSISHFTFTVGCPSDYNGDGFSNGDDFDAYVVAFEAGDAPADMNADGFVTGDDYDAFVAAFEVGC